MQCLYSNNADFLLHRFRLSKSLQDRTLCPNKTFNDTTITISVKKKEGQEKTLNILTTKKSNQKSWFSFFKCYSLIIS